MENTSRRFSWFEVFVGLGLLAVLATVLLRPFRLFNVGNITINRYGSADGPASKGTLVPSQVDDV